jgi:hypothetical protein
MKHLDRREFLRIGGTCIAGIAVSQLDIPYLKWLSSRPALAGAIDNNSWTFGVMSDTQWKAHTGNQEESASSCATTIIDTLNEQFIQHNCKFVIQVGDLINNEEVDNVRTLPTRAAHCTALYNQGIGFFPVRGNHEASSLAATEIPVLFPQTLGQDTSMLFGASNVDSPENLPQLQGLSYSFDYDNVRCVLIDQFNRPDGKYYDAATNTYKNGSNINDNAIDQISWIADRVSSRPQDSHAFIFSHKNLIGQNHKDVLFGGSMETINDPAMDSFIQILDTNGVRYCLGGHDHMHHRSTITDSEQEYNVDQIITSSNSYKFYIPRSGDDDREIPVCQELATIGYYIFTIDGPRVTVDFYSSSHGDEYGDTDLKDAPSSFTFYLRERFGYSLNGKSWIVNCGDEYTIISDSYNGTSVEILSGVNENDKTDYLGRELHKTVNTGWADAGTVDNALSNVFSLWGMIDNLSLWEKPPTKDFAGLLPDESEKLITDSYTISMSYSPRKVRPSQVMSGSFAIAAKDEQKNWVNAVDLNFEGTKKFVMGPWKSTYELGTYGVDPKTCTAWAVLNHEGNFVLKFV